MLLLPYITGVDVLSTTDDHNPTGILLGPRFAGIKSLLDTPAKGKVISAEAAKTSVYAQLNDPQYNYLAADTKLRLADNNYYLPTHDEIQFILEESQLERRHWLEDRFDCDDFAFVLKGEISSHTYKAGQLKCGLCFGIAWGHFAWVNEYHAANWFLDADNQLFFIEPRWDTFHRVEHCRGGIDLILA